MNAVTTFSRMERDTPRRAGVVPYQRCKFRVSTIGLGSGTADVVGLGDGDMKIRGGDQWLERLAPRSRARTTIPMALSENVSSSSTRTVAYRTGFVWSMLGDWVLST